MGRDILMAAPTAPTVDSIVLAALTRFYNSSAPTDAAEIAIAKSNGFESVKRDIMALGRKWRPLLRTACQVTEAHVSKYPNAADYREDFTIGLMSGTRTGLLTGVAVDGSTVTLAVAETVTKADAEGSMLLIASGTGGNQATQIKSYDTATKTATLAEKYATNPVIGDGYLVVSTTKDLHRYPIQIYEKFTKKGVPGVPDHYVTVPDDSAGDTALIPTPDGVYGLERKYFADLLLLDDASPLFTFLLRRWERVFEQGVYVWKLGEDDDRYAGENTVYQGLLQAQMVKDLIGYAAPAEQAAAGG
jgi:hypothetical protein